MRDDGDGEITYQEKVVRPNFTPAAIRDQLRQQFQPRRPAIETPSPPPPSSPPPAREQAGAAATSEKPHPLPRSGDAYRGNGRHGNKPELTLYVVTRDFKYGFFSYSNLEEAWLATPGKPGTSPAILLRFNGSVVTEMTLEGRSLDSLFHLIGLHRVPWVWEHPVPGEFVDEKATLVSRINIDRIER